MERREIFDKFDVSGVVATLTCEEERFLKFQRPWRLSAQLIPDFPVPGSTRLEALAIRMKDHDFFSAERSSRRNWAEQPSCQLKPKERLRDDPHINESLRP